MPIIVMSGTTMKELSGGKAMNTRSVLVTGASSGVGRACALQLSEHGFHVYAGVRREEDGESVRAAAKGLLTPVMLDVTQSAAIEAAAAMIREESGDFYALVGNAGITIAGPVELLPIDMIRTQFEVNVFGQLAVIKSFLPLLRRSHGRIVIVGSILGKFSLPFLAPYSASKFALEAIADSLAMEVGQWGISVTLLEPGNVATPIWQKAERRALETIDDFPDPGRELYRERIGAFHRYTTQAAMTGIPPDRVAAVVRRALAARKPRSRYAIGWDARILGRCAQLVPGRLRRLIVQRVVLR
jgi:NAD(P)-dependent dehydrogenase (short-subunit alcohol dehydrogenase family)